MKAFECNTLPNGADERGDKASDSRKEADNGNL
jgi:hypothetical protein